MPNLRTLSAGCLTALVTLAFAGVYAKDGEKTEKPKKTSPSSDIKQADTPRRNLRTSRPRRSRRHRNPLLRN